MFRKILVACDGSEGANLALDRAIELARAFEADICTVAVMEHLPRYAASLGEIEEAQEQGRDHLNDLLDEARARAARAGLSVTTAQVAGQPAHAIVRYARDHDFDLIVLGHSGHSGVWGTFLGTTPEKAVQHAHCSVLIVRGDSRVDL
jgi:nucleotide-binding universal stress UspA family protein